MPNLRKGSKAKGDSNPGSLLPLSYHSLIRFICCFLCSEGTTANIAIVSFACRPTVGNPMAF